MIRGSAEHLLTLVNDLLDLSRIEAGILDLTISPLKVKDIFHDVSATISSLAKEKGLNLTFTCEENLPEVHTDLKRVLQVLLNLLGNAVKFTERGDITTTASTQLIAGREHIRIEVKDTGVGIPADRFNTIFDEFTQVHVDHAKKKGTGLGLAITKTLLTHLGGDIGLESEPGKGSTFSLTLPVEFPGEKEKPPVRPTAKKGDFAGETVLIVEDDEKAIYSLRKVLEKEGYRVLTARTPEGALRMASADKPSLVLLDILMPAEEDGWMVLKALRRNPGTRGIPVVVTTVLHTAEEKAMALGADEYMIKPIDMDELLGRLRYYQQSRELETILVVDDEEPVLMGFTSYLSEYFRLLTARDGKEALKVLENEEPDLIILDLVMPVMDGFEFLSRLRKEKRYKGIPVIVYSSKELNEKEERMLGKDALEIINKHETKIEEFPMKLTKVFNVLRYGRHEGENITRR